MQGSVLVSRKSSSTPSLSEAVEPKLTVASTDQVASAENLTSSSSSEPVCCLHHVHFLLTLQKKTTDFNNFWYTTY